MNKGLNWAFCIKLVEKVILIAPLAVFALISATVAEFGFDILGTLFWYALTAILAMAIVTFILYPSIVKIFAKVSPRETMITVISLLL